MFLYAGTCRQPFLSYTGYWHKAGVHEAMHCKQTWMTLLLTSLTVWNPHNFGLYCQERCQWTSFFFFSCLPKGQTLMGLRGLCGVPWFWAFWPMEICLHYIIATLHYIGIPLQEGTNWKTWVPVLLSAQISTAVAQVEWGCLTVVGEGAVISGTFHKTTLSGKLSCAR